MSNPTRAEQLELYGNAYALLLDAVREFPEPMWTYRSSDALWTIHEILVHITDSEANSYVRCRRCIAEPGSTVMGYDETQWARALDYHAQDALEALELFRWLRLRTHRLLLTLDEAVWAQTIVHSESGVMTLDDWLGVYARHIPDHIAQMREVYQGWLSTQMG